MHFRIFILLRACGRRTIKRGGERTRVACSDQDTVFLCIRILMTLGFTWVNWVHLKMQIATNICRIMKNETEPYVAYCFKINEICR